MLTRRLRAPGFAGADGHRQNYLLVQWQPTREGYLQFLAESRLLFQTLEDIMAQAPHPDCAPYPHSLSFALSYVLSAVLSAVGRQ